MSTWVQRKEVAIKCGRCGKRTLERLTDEELSTFVFPPRVKYKCHPNHCGAQHVIGGSALSGLVDAAKKGTTKGERTVWLG